MNKKWFKEKRVSFKIGLFLAVLHFIFSLFVANDVIGWSQNAQWQFYWEFPFTVDFPISIIYKLAFYLPIDFSFTFLPYPISEFRSFILPFLLHSIIGTIWYFYLPILVANFFRRRSKSIFKFSPRLIFGLSSLSLGLILLILCFTGIDFIKNIAIYIIFISMSLIVIGLFFIFMSFIFKQ